MASRAAKQFGESPRVFQQDSASPHKANITQTWLAQNVPSYVSRNEWPPNSPDLNPCDYYLWGRLEDLVNTKRFTSLDELKAAIVAAWEALDDTEVADACRMFEK